MNYLLASAKSKPTDHYILVFPVTVFLKWNGNKTFFIYAFTLYCMSMCVYEYAVAHVEFRRLLVGVGPFLPLCGLQCSNPGYQAGSQVPLSTKPFHWPLRFN